MYRDKKVAIPMSSISSSLQMQVSEYWNDNFHHLSHGPLLPLPFINTYGYRQKYPNILHFFLFKAAGYQNHLNFQYNVCFDDPQVENKDFNRTSKDHNETIK